MTDFDEDDPLANRNRAADLERIKQARKKRVSQLKSWQQYDKLMEKNRGSFGKPLKSKNKRNIHFPQSLVLLEAAGRGDIEEVKQILQDGADPDVCNEDGLTALHQCCIDNNLTICQLLLQFGVNVNATDSELWTPLHAAAACAHIDICSCLIESGAELLALNAEGNMPYDICEEENTLDLIENAMAIRGISQEDIDERRKVPEMSMLQDMRRVRGDLLVKMDEQGATFLHVAASSGYMDVVKFLLDNDVPVDILDKDGWQAVHVAACWGQLEVIELLLVRGADINATTRLGETIYDICEDPEMNQRLVQLKQEIERQHEIKKTLDVRPCRNQLNRRSTSTKRSASIRRSSMREKSLMSWKEARQEALIREAVQKQISTDVTTDSGIASGQSDIASSQMNGTKDEEIDISQVLVNVQLVTENEMALKEPLIRRGSTRNSFTHSHPYHSPSRDPTLMEASIDESSSVEDNKDVDDDEDDRRNRGNDMKPFVPPPSSGSTRASQRNGKNQPSMGAISKPREVSNELKKVPANNSSFIRGCNPNSSIKSTQPLVNNVSQREKPRKEIVNRPLVKAQKTQGCCVLM